MKINFDINDIMHKYCELKNGDIFIIKVPTEHCSVYMKIFAEGKYNVIDLKDGRLSYICGNQEVLKVKGELNISI